VYLADDLLDFLLLFRIQAAVVQRAMQLRGRPAACGGAGTDAHTRMSACTGIALCWHTCMLAPEACCKRTWQLAALWAQHAQAANLLSAQQCLQPLVGGRAMQDSRTVSCTRSVACGRGSGALCRSACRHATLVEGLLLAPHHSGYAVCSVCGALQQRAVAHPRPPDVVVVLKKPTLPSHHCLLHTKNMPQTLKTWA
jgi:hypothetical protein